MRQRIFEDDESVRLLKNYWIEGGITQFSYPTTVIGNKKFDQMFDVVTPKFRELVKQGVIVNNPMYRQIIKLEFKTGYYKRIGTINSQPYERFQTFGLLPTSAYQEFSPDLIAFSDFLKAFESEGEVAVTKAWSEVDESAILGAASLGELPETVRWVVSIFTRLIKILRLAKGKKLGALLSSEVGKGSKVDLFSDTWLELRYAVRPLAFELQQAIEALHAQIEEGARHTGRGYSTHFDQVATTTPGQTAADVSWVVTNTTSRSSNYRAGVLYTIGDNINSLQTVWGLDQPLEAVWELIPFSFIIDWFFNIGNVISSWSVNPSLLVKASWLRETHQVVQERRLYDWRNISNAPYSSLSFTSEPGLTKLTHIVTRRVPSPTRSTTPHFKLNLDLAKILDLATIVRSLLQGCWTDPPYYKPRKRSRWAKIRGNHVI